MIPVHESNAYVGFPPLPSKDDIVQALVNDPPERRWRMVRQLFRLAEPADRQELIARLQPFLNQVDDFRVKYRLMMALRALHNPYTVADYVVVAGRGAWRAQELPQTPADWERWYQTPPEPSPFPIVDFHIHPKSPDLKFMADLKEAGVTHAVILATDTDPADVDRPEIRAKLQADYSRAALSHRLPFEQMLRQIRASIYSYTHVTNLDVADWVEDYPDILIGFGSVNLGKGKDYVEAKLQELAAYNFAGFKLLPYSQFLNPAENEAAHLLFAYCEQHHAIVLTHTGCGAGPFELLELSENNHPGLWEPLVKRYPDVPVVLAHFGAYSTHVPGIWLYEAMQLAKKYDNVYADLAAVTWLLERENVVKEIRKTLGFDRVLFATDYPLPLASGISLALLVKQVQTNMYLTEKEKHLVLGRNALKLLGRA